MGGAGATGASQRTPLTLDRIVDAALVLATDEGVDAVSMRRVAKELGAAPMSLYNHIADKQALLDALAERAIGPVEIDVEPDSPWTDVMRSWALALRAAMLDARAVWPSVANPDRIGLLLHSGRDAIARLTESGMDDGEVRELVRIVARYIVGAVVVDAAPVTRPFRTRTDLDDTFLAGLDALLAGLDAARPTATAR